MALDTRVRWLAEADGYRLATQRAYRNRFALNVSLRASMYVAVDADLAE